MSVHLIPEYDDGHRFVPLARLGPNVITSRRDPVKPVPEGTYVAMVFRVTGYEPDCDGSLMARLEQVDRYGKPSGWEPDRLGLGAASDVVLDEPGDLHHLADATSGGSAAAPR